LASKVVDANGEPILVSLVEWETLRNFVTTQSLQQATTKVWQAAIK
jgi:hypothetical protein